MAGLNQTPKETEFYWNLRQKKCRKIQFHQSPDKTRYRFGEQYSRNDYRPGVQGYGNPSFGTCDDYRYCRYR